MHTDEYPKALKRRQEGFTLIEIMIALAIVAVAIALAIKPVHQALSNAKANDEMGELPTIIANIQKVFANRANFGGATQELFVNQHVFPTERVVPQTAELANRWGGAITTSVVTIGSSASNNGIALTYEGVPSMECAAVIPQMDEIVRIISVNGTQVKAAPYTDWHVDIDKPETSVVFLSENETGEALVHAQPMRVPEPLRPLLFHLIERLQAHVSAGDPHSFAIDLGSMRFRGERLRPARYALRRTQQRVESLKALRLGAGAEQLLLDPEFCSGGLILISGEHGARKSTTARATVVDRLKTYGGYCLTVESPVEVEFEGFHGAGYMEQVVAN